MALPEAFETQRLSARLPVPADAAALFASYAADPRVSRYMIWQPHASVDVTATFIDECIAAAASGRRFPYILSTPSTGELIGMLEARPEGHKVDLGYVLKPSAWGSGFMPEAIAGFAAIALQLPSVYRVQAFCDVENSPSQRALEKAGFLREGRHERFVVHRNLSSEPRPCYMYAKCR